MNVIGEENKSVKTQLNKFWVKSSQSYIINRNFVTIIHARNF
jgi:hypothetical protein